MPVFFIRSGSECIVEVQQGRHVGTAAAWLKFGCDLSHGISELVQLGIL